MKLTRIEDGDYLDEAGHRVLTVVSICSSELCRVRMTDTHGTPLRFILIGPATTEVEAEALRDRLALALDPSLAPPAVNALPDVAEAADQLRYHALNVLFDLTPLTRSPCSPVRSTEERNPMTFTTLEEYDDAIAVFDRQTIIDGDPLAYYRLGLISEIGELAGLVKKLYRDHGGVIIQEFRLKFIDELGDVLWYVARPISLRNKPSVVFRLSDEVSHPENNLISLVDGLHRASSYATFETLSVLAELAGHVGVSLADVAARNHAKLADRAARGVIQGSGDNR